LARSLWRRVRDSNLPSLEASRPEGAAFQGKLRFPGRVPFRGFYGSAPSSWRRRLENHGRSPALRIPCCFYGVLVGSWARALVGSIPLAEGEGFEPPGACASTVFKKAQGRVYRSIPECYLVHSSHTQDGESATTIYSVFARSALWCDLELAIFLQTPWRQFRRSGGESGTDLNKKRLIEEGAFFVSQ